MGFDIECIIGIHNYPGEYFCPVCRTLVYPNEALQSPCTHLYCKPCLAHVAHNSRACPYDGYLVTEVSSKPLVESDKALAENIGKVKVRCLYHRSGCAWEGRLSECMSHCSACAFGNSPVICNRCGNQIVHSQVHDHAQSCPGVYQVQQAAGAAQVAPSFSLTAVTGAVPNQASSQAGAPTSQAQNSQIAPAPFLPGQDSNQQVNANSQAPAAVPASVSMTEQWYQQQYQQYYQQYAGYDPYQQAYLQYYRYQQLSAQQYQQHPPQVLGQPQLQVYAQAAAQLQAQSSSHPQVQPQAQPQSQHPVQSQAQPQPPAQTQVVPSQVKTQAQVQPHGPPLLHSQLQPLAPQNRNQAQELLYPAMHSHAQNPSQAHSVHGLSAAQTHQPQPQPQPQHAQAHNQQPHLQVHHPQPSQVHPQSHLLTQTRSQPQSQSQIQPQPLLQTHMRPTQPNQPTVLSAQPPSVHSSGPVVSGHQSYLQPQPPQQQPIPAQLASGSLPPVQMQGQVLPQPPLTRPPSSQVPVPNQQQTLFPSQGQVPSMPPAQQQQFHSQTPQLSHSNQRHPVIHSTQHLVPQQYVQQPPFSSTVQSQLSDNNHLLQQPPLQSQLLPQGPPHMMQQSSNAHLQLQQNVAVAPGVQPQQPQNYVVRPLMSNQAVPTQPLPFAQSSSGFLAGSQGMPAQFGPFQHSANQDYANKMNNQLQTAADQQLIQSGMTLTSGRMLRQGDSVSEKTSIVYESGLPPQNPVGNVANTRRVDSFELTPQKSEVGMSYEQATARESTDKSRKNESLARDTDYGLRGGIDGPERQFALQRSANPAEVEMLQNQSHFDGDHMKLPGSFERGPFGHHSGVEPNALRMNVGSGLHKSSLGSHDERFKAMSGGHMNPFAKEPTWPQDQGSRSLDRPPTALNYAAGRTLGSAAGGLTTRVLPPHHASGGPGIVRHNGKNLISGSPDKDYLGMKISSSGEGSRRNLPLDPQGNPLHENRFLPLPGYPLRGEHDGPTGLRFGEHSVPGHHDHLRRADMFGPDIQPSHFLRGEFLGSGTSSSRFGPFPGHAQVGELPGPANPPHKFHYGEPYADNKPGLPRLGEPGIRSSFSLPGFPSDRLYAGDISKFDNSRKRKHPSMGWCRICKVDCETVEGLDMHSQTREHQHMSMHMVMSIKQQNKKNSKPSSDCAREEIGSNKRNSGPDGRGKKP